MVTDPCIFFAFDGHCASGDQCSFSHDNQNASCGKESNTPFLSVKDNNSATCVYWMKGCCKKGEKCRYAHKDTSQTEVKLARRRRSSSSQSASSHEGEISSNMTQLSEPNDSEADIDEENTQEKQLFSQNDSSSEGRLTEDMPKYVRPRTDSLPSKSSELDNETPYDHEQTYENEDVKRHTPLDAIQPPIDWCPGPDDEWGDEEPDETAQTSEEWAENDAPVGQLEEGNRSLDTVIAENYDSTGGAPASEELHNHQERQQDAAEARNTQTMGATDVCGDTPREQRSQAGHEANESDGVPHWTEYADPHANPLTPFCKFFARGRCNQGEACTYRHAITVQEYLLLFGVPPVMWSQYTPNENNFSSNAQPSSSLGSCKFYPLGKCRNGDKCPYAHVDLPDSVPESEEQNYNEWEAPNKEDNNIDWSSRGRRPCKYFMNYGSCTRGEDCRFSHNEEDINPALNDAERREQEQNWKQGGSVDRDPGSIWNNETPVDWGVDGPSADESTESKWVINDGEEATGVLDKGEHAGVNGQPEQQDDSGWGAGWGNEKPAASGNSGNRESRTSWRQNDMRDKVCYGFLRGDCRRDACRIMHQALDNRQRAEMDEQRAQQEDHGGSGAERGNDEPATPEHGSNREPRTGSRQNEQNNYDKVCYDFLRGECRRAACIFMHQADNPACSDRRSNNRSADGTRRSTWDDSSADDKKTWPTEGGRRPNPETTHESGVLPNAHTRSGGGNSEIEWGSEGSGINKGVCRGFLEGRCSRRACNFLHDVDGRTTNDTANNNRNECDSQPSTWDPPQAESSSDPNAASWNDNWLEANFTSYTTRASSKLQEPCIYFGQGFCSMGDSCRMLHIPPDTPIDDQVEEDSDEQGTEDQEMCYDADLQTERSVFNCTVAYGAGCRVLHMLTSVDPNQVILTDLPSKFSLMEIRNLPIPFEGLREVRPDNLNTVPGAILEFETREQTLTALCLLHGYVLRGSALTARCSAGPALGSILANFEVKITWPAPSRIAWTRYPSVTLAKEDAVRLDGQIFESRKVKASYIPAKKGQTNMFSVQITNLPSEITETSIKQRCTGCQFVNLTQPTYAGSAVERISDLLLQHGTLISFHAPEMPSYEEALIGFARFDDPMEAASAILALHRRNVDFLGREGSLKVEAINLARFNISLELFRCIQGDLEILRDSHHDRAQCSILIVPSITEINIYAHGHIDDAPAFLKLLASLNTLVYGEILKQEGIIVWDDYLHTSSGVKAIDKLNAGDLKQYDVLIVPDYRNQQICIHGQELNRPRARESMLKLLKKVRSAWNEVPFDRIFVRWYLEQGQGQIRQDTEIGQNKVSIDLTVPKLIVKGDSKVLSKVKEIMLSATAIRKEHPEQTRVEVCHICLHKPASPVRLTCKHCYCKECLVALLASADENICIPLACIAIEANTDANRVQCGKGIPLVVVRDLLPTANEETLLRRRFLAYVRSNPDDFFLCPTPDCNTVHRYAEKGTLTRCSSCMHEICSSCRTRFHPGATCEEWREIIM